MPQSPPGCTRPFHLIPIPHYSQILPPQYNQTISSHCPPASPLYPDAPNTAQSPSSINQTPSSHCPPLPHSNQTLPVCPNPSQYQPEPLISLTSPSLSSARHLQHAPVLPSINQTFSTQCTPPCHYNHTLPVRSSPPQYHHRPSHLISSFNSITTRPSSISQSPPVSTRRSHLTALPVAVTNRPPVLPSINPSLPVHPFPPPHYRLPQYAPVPPSINQTPSSHPLPLPSNNQPLPACPGSVPVSTRPSHFIALPHSHYNQMPPSQYALVPPSINQTLSSHPIPLPHYNQMPPVCPSPSQCQPDPLISSSPSPQ